MKRIESEKALEARLVREVTALGGLCIKQTSQYHRGLPDRLVLLPSGRVFFCEMKTTGKHPEPLQIRAMQRLSDLGFRSYVIDTTESLDAFLKTASEQ